MSKAKSETSSNVQDNPVVKILQKVEGRTLLSAPIDSVIPDPEKPNVRGRVVDTTDIQPSIREHGILQPILVRPHPKQDGVYYRIAGERRQVAARAVGLKEIPIIVGEDLKESDIRRIMLASDLHKREPHIVLDTEGNVIAGKCRAVHEELADEGSKITKQDLADDMGVSSDIVSAYNELYTDIPEIQEKVAKRQLAITAYSLIKHHGPEIKLYIAGVKGKRSANYVRQTLKDWNDKIKPKLDGDSGQVEVDDDQLSILDIEGVLDEETVKSKTISLKVKKRMTVTQLLNGAFDNLNKIVVFDGQLSETDWTIVDQIYSVLEAINEDR